MLRISLIISLLIFLNACNSPLDKKYNTETFEEDAQAISESNKLNDDDAELLAKYILLARLEGRNLEEKTYKEILEEAKRIKHAEGEASRLQLEADEKAKRMNELVDVQVVDKSFVPKDSTRIGLKIILVNKKGKDIKRIIGTIVFADRSSIEIRRVPIDISLLVPANAGTRHEEYIAYSEYMEDNRKFNEMKIKDMKISWIGERIIYTDLSSID